ncbi:MAG: 2,4-dihydroxyhept-2-ene-1,7-dioic acid aldolase [Burkholderiaceae bacterium]|jgi:4-hydroxy-2-oxoheptanedioate aldolase|nr:MAG: 2,4-dihydroxyhept-2-ene-1,7-dioic acid aldolase [Burkholderiaceae bacterium]
MKTPVNPFKLALRNRQPQIGLWLGLADAYSAELCAGAGFDWLLIDGEHSPNDLKSILAQLQAIAPYPSHAIARVPVGHGHVGQALIKQYLDLGAQTLLVPMVDTPQQAAAVVRSMRYPQSDGNGGIRGMGGARASRWGRYPAYVREANEQVCLLVQIESREALANLEAIAAVDGVDGIFIGPADLSASLGHPGDPGHPDAQAAIDDAIARIVRTGRAAGILSTDEALARHYLQLGATFVAVGLDTNLLMRGTSVLVAKFKSGMSAAPASKVY